MVEHASETVVKYANIIHRCIEEDNPHKIITSLCMMTREERKSVVSYKVNSNPTLCFACLNNRLGIVKYLITECDADIEQRGFYLEPTQNTRIEAPPLWCATIPVNGIDVVRFLVEHGADINGYSDTQSTPLRAACFENNIPLVRYLVENGADVRKTNIRNQTCLMNSVRSSELCEYLLRNGADVKSTDSYGNTALHFAVYENILDSVTLLIKYDADIYYKANDGESLLRTAAYKGHDSIVEYLLNIGSYSGEDIVEAYDLLGAFHVDDDISKCLTVWTKALEIRSKSDLGVTHLNCITNNPDVFQNSNELLTVDEVQKLTDPNDIHMQALLKYYRIYGENHVNTSSEIMYRGEVYLENGCYQTCINLWKYAYRLRYKEEDPLDRNSIYSARKVIYAFCEMQRACENSSTTDKLDINDLIATIDLLVTQMKCGKRFLRVFPTNLADIEQYQYLMELTLHCIHMYQGLKADPIQREKFVNLLCRLVHLDPRGTVNQTLLHLAVNPNTSKIESDEYTTFPSVDAVRILLLCGATSSSKDEHGYTAFQSSIKFCSDLHAEDNK